MKKIHINQQFKEDWTRVLNHIANLFYEDSVIQIEQDGADMLMAFEHSIDETFTVQTTAKLTVENKTYTSNYSIGYATEGTEKEQNILIQ